MRILSGRIIGPRKAQIRLVSPLGWVVQQQHNQRRLHWISTWFGVVSVGLVHLSLSWSWIRWTMVEYVSAWRRCAAAALRDAGRARRVRHTWRTASRKRNGRLLMAPRGPSPSRLVGTEERCGMSARATSVWARAPCSGALPAMAHGI
jgi:hypothetical protein